MTDSPFFSLVIPTYNRAHLISKTIFSLLNQTLNDYEIIIVDDGSSDNTKEVIDKIGDPRIRYFYKANGQMGSARNYGVKNAKGKYINFFDSDDLAYTFHLQKAFEFIQENNDAIVFHFSYDIKNLNGEITRIPTQINNLRKQLLYDNPLSVESVFIKKDIAIKYPFNEDRNLAGAADYLLWLQLSSRFPFISNNTITSTLIDHHDRSVFDYNRDKIVIRVNSLLKYIFQDKEINVVYGKSKNTIFGLNYSFLALHLVLEKHKQEGVKYLIKSLIHYPQFIFKRRFYAIIKHLII